MFCLHYGEVLDHTLFLVSIKIWPMDTDNGVGMHCGGRGWAGWRRAKGENWDNCNRINKNKKRLNLLIWAFKCIIC